MTAADAIKQLAKAMRTLEARVDHLEQQLADQVTLEEEVGDLGLSPDTDAAIREAARGVPIEKPKARIVQGDIVEYPPPTPAQERLRTAVLDRIGLEGLPPEHDLKPDDARRAFLKGGPLWLYDFDRNFVVGLSPQVRRAFVEDVYAVDPEAAYDLGRDILKDDSPGEPEFAIEKDKQWRALHGGGTGATI